MVKYSKVMFRCITTAGKDERKRGANQRCYGWIKYGTKYTAELPGTCGGSGCKAYSVAISAVKHGELWYSRLFRGIPGDVKRRVPSIGGRCWLKLADAIMAAVLREMLDQFPFAAYGAEELHALLTEFGKFCMQAYCRRQPCKSDGDMIK